METHKKEEDIQYQDIQKIKVWTDILKLNKEMDLDSRWLQLHNNIRFKRSQRHFFQIMRNVAAVLLLPFIAATMYLYFHNKSMTESESIAQIETECGYWQTSKVILPDGSEVLLNSGSKLRYPQRFTGNNRTVYLTGEAYFKVQADPEHRFDVKLPGGLITSAYGTEFNITAYEDLKNIEVTLVSGHVELTDADKKQSLKMQSDQCAMYSRAKKTLIITDEDVYAKTAWKDGKLVFRHAGIEEIAERLSRRYNIEIEVKDPAIFNHEYSATFTTESIDNVMRLLSQIAPINYKFYDIQQKDDLTFSKRKLVLKMQE